MGTEHRRSGHRWDTPWLPLSVMEEFRWRRYLVIRAKNKWTENSAEVDGWWEKVYFDTPWWKAVPSISAAALNSKWMFIHHKIGQWMNNSSTKPDHSGAWKRAMECQNSNQLNWNGFQYQGMVRMDVVRVHIVHTSTVQSTSRWSSTYPRLDKLR